MDAELRHPPLRTGGPRTPAEGRRPHPGILEDGRAATTPLAQLNEEYRRTGLTMGGVADCIALVFALEKASRQSSSTEPPKH